MLGIPFQAAERAEKRWIVGALVLALVLHGLLAGGFAWYHIKGLEIPSDHSNPTGPFTVKSIEMRPDALKTQPDPTTNLPQPEPPKNPAQFELDPNLVVKALQAPLPKLSAPAVPEPAKVIAATDLTQNLPFIESNSANITAEISKVQPPSESGGPLASSKLAQDLISNTSGYPHPGDTPVNTTGTGSTSNLPGFGALAPGFKAPGANVSNLPDPVLLRLPSDVLFDFNSAVLKPEAAPLLSQAIGLITKYPSADVQIDGYSDSFGKQDYNLSLSQQRAQVVQEWLNDRVTQAGYKFRSQGHGSTNYVVPAQGSIDQQQPNRRVEILIQALKP